MALALGTEPAYLGKWIEGAYATDVVTMKRIVDILDDSWESVRMEIFDDPRAMVEVPRDWLPAFLPPDDENRAAQLAARNAALATYHAVYGSLVPPYRR